MNGGLGWEGSGIPYAVFILLSDNTSVPQRVREHCEIPM